MAKITANGKVFSSPLTVIYKTPKGWTLELSFYPDGGDVDAHIYNKRKTTDETITAVDLDDYEDDEVAEVTSNDFLYSAIDAFSVDNPKIPAYDEWTLERIKPTNGFSSESKNETKFDPSQYDFFKASYTLDGTNHVKNTNGIVDAQGTLEMAQRHGATNLNLVGVKDGTETNIPLSDVGITKSKNESMSLKGFLENLKEKLTKQYDLDEAEVKFYLDSHTQEMQELLDDKELSLKEKVLFVRGEITGEKDEAKEPTEEKLGYEKGHKNSKGEDAPWVIRSHEDNRILASFAKKTDAEEHLQRMKQYSKKETKKSEDLETYACFIDFETEDDAKKGMELVKGWHPFRRDTAVLIDGLGEDAANHLWNDWKRKCAKAGLAISDEGEVYKEEPACTYNSKSEATNLAGYISDIKSELCVIWHYGEDGAEKLADKYADYIRNNYVDGDMYASETAREIAKMDGNGYANENKKSEVHRELIDTIIVPKWLWDAHLFGNEYGEDLDEHEQEILARFEEEYVKPYYLDDRSEEADFHSRNDFDEYGGPCYEVDVYKES